MDISYCLLLFCSLFGWFGWSVCFLLWWGRESVSFGVVCDVSSKLMNSHRGYAMQKRTSSNWMDSNLLLYQYLDTDRCNCQCVRVRVCAGVGVGLSTNTHNNNNCIGHIRSICHNQCTRSKCSFFHSMNSYCDIYRFNHGRPIQPRRSALNCTQSELLLWCIRHGYSYDP